MFDTDSNWLYVGITCDIGSRFASHEDLKPWWTQVARIDVEHFTTRDEALTAERAEIKSKRPRWNIVHNNPSEPTALSYMARVYTERDRMVQVLVEAGFTSSDIRRGLCTSPANVYKSLSRLLAAGEISALPPSRSTGGQRNRSWEEVQQAAEELLGAAGLAPPDAAIQPAS